MRAREARNTGLRPEKTTFLGLILRDQKRELLIGNLKVEGLVLLSEILGLEKTHSKHLG